jgi:5-methyltetrahydrofolate--homocysteine methyltransferase
MPNGLCLSDYILDPQDGRRDGIAVFAVTAGGGVRERAEEAKQKGEYFKSVALLALATETAEATAEWLHRRIREDWGFPDPADMPMQQRWTAKYRGKRYSFGYGACPRMEDQVGLFRLIDPGEIGMALTEGFMMEPEASVSALVFHHPSAAYFTAANTDDAVEE